MRPSRLRAARWIAITATALALIPAGLAVATRIHERPVESGPVVFSACTLPVLVGDENNLGAGFVDTATGAYRPAQPAPFQAASNGSQLAAYDHITGRWLHIPPDVMSPDGRYYAYMKQGPNGEELHRSEIATGLDVLLHMFDQTFYLEAWRVNGIRLGQAPNGWEYWLVDPSSGAAVHYPAHAPYPWISQPGDPTEVGFGFGLGYTLEGQPIWPISQMGGTLDWVIYDTPQGERVYIYKGTTHDSTGFFPVAGLADQTGVWFADAYGGRFLWRWSSDKGLKRIDVSGLPPGLPSPMNLIPAGSCF